LLEQIEARIFVFIRKLDIFPLMCTTDPVWITKLTFIHKKMLGQFVTRMRKFIGQFDIKYIMMLVLKALTDIITNIPAHPIGLAEILTIMSVSTFKIAVILYILYHLGIKEIVLLLYKIQSINVSWMTHLNPRKFEDTKWIIRSHKSKDK
jgi:hypothetical protein